MKNNIFLIRSLDNGWGWPDIYSENNAELYYLEKLEVPEEHDDVEYFKEAFQLTLKRQKIYHNDDWYVNLMLCA